MLHMARMRNILWLPLAVLILSLPAGRTSGFSYFAAPDPNSPGGELVPIVWGPKESVRYLSPTTFPVGTVPELHVLAAMGLWNIVPGADFEYFYTTAEQDFPVDHMDGFNDTLAVDPEDLDFGVLGVTFLVNDQTDPTKWFDMDILFSANPLNAGYTFNPNPSCGLITTPLASGNGFSFLLVATHEMGHALGLGHNPVGDETPGTPWFIATMNPRYPSGGPVGQENIIELHTDDRNGARFLYPPVGGPEMFIDLAQPGYIAGPDVVGEAVPVSFDPPVVTPGVELTANSVLENFGTTNELSVRQGFYLSSDSVTDSGDLFLGALLWDLPAGGGFAFEVGIDIPDVTAGTYYLGSILDDLELIAEEFEDNNAVTYCEPLVINQLAPVINPLSQRIVSCDEVFTGPTPTVTFPVNMAPITWSLDDPPAGMTIHSTTGVITWAEPVPSSFQYEIVARATNAAGSGTRTLLLGVERAAPQVESIEPQFAFCNPGYVAPTPALALPDCMEPIFNWSLDFGPPGMTVNAGTGVVSWAEPIPASTPYDVTLRATNIAGNGSVSWQLFVLGGDLDGSGLRDRGDVSDMVACLAGPGSSLAAGCTCGDTDGDGDVDLRDLAAFHQSFAE